MDQLGNLRISLTSQASIRYFGERLIRAAAPDRKRPFLPPEQGPCFLLHPSNGPPRGLNASRKEEQAQRSWRWISGFRDPWHSGAHPPRCTFASKPRRVLPRLFGVLKEQL
jgi:hypothetical protein